jgi:uncharacterized protein YbaP (TraB family)
MIRTTRIISVILLLILALTLQIGVYAQEQQTQAQTQTQAAAPVEQPSAWAFDGVNWSAIYGLARQDMFAKYAAKANREELYAVGDNLYTRLTGKTITPVKQSPFTDTDKPSVLVACAIGILSGEGKFEPAKEATRLEMVTIIYNTLKAANVGLKFDSNNALTAVDAGEIPAASLDVVKYSVAKGLLKGVGNNTLGLLAPCSRQELMVFAGRAYELAVYETGNASKGLLWKASDKDSTVYLLGSIHVANPSIYPLSKAMLNAFEKSDALVVEADIANQNDGIKYMQQKMMYTGTDALDRNVPRDVYDRFVEAIKPLGLKPEVYNKLKPWYAAMLVQNIQMEQNSYSANLGIDLYFTAKATGKKPIIEIEGLKFQVDMFDSFSKELQEQYLSATLAPDKSSQQQQADAITAIMKAWKAGDAAAAEKLLVVGDDSSVEAKEFNEKLWTARDNNMYQKTKTYLADPVKKTYFIVVGAGHMEGEDGIVTQLKRNGYSVEQVN